VVGTVVQGQQQASGDVETCKSCPDRCASVPTRAGGKHLRLAGACIFIFLLALAARLYQVQNESVWYDESVAAYELMPGIGLGTFLRNVKAYDPTLNPLYFTVLWVWSNLFGTAAFTLRMLSIIMGCLSVVFLYCIGKEVFNGRMAVATATILGILSIPNIFYSQEIRMYAAFLLLTNMSIWGLLRIYKNGDRLSFVVHIGANVLMVWTHLMSSVFLIVQGMIVLLLYGKNVKFLLKWGIPQAINAMCFWMAWGRFIDFAAIRKAADWIGSSLTMDMSWVLLVFVRNISGISATVYGKSLYVLILFFIFLLLTSVVYKKIVKGIINWVEIIIILLAMAPVVFLFAVSVLVYPCLLDRYVVYIQTSAIIAVVMGCGVLGRRGGALANGILIALFLAQFATFDRPFRLNWDKIMALADDGRPVVVSPAHERQTLKPLAMPPVGVDAHNFKDYLNSHDEQLRKTGWWFVNAAASSDLNGPFLTEIEAHGFCAAKIVQVRGINKTIFLYLVQDKK